jgi:hypothetical protein
MHSPGAERAGVDLVEKGVLPRELLILAVGSRPHRKGRPMNYSTVLMALVASQRAQVEAEVDDLLQPLLRNVVQLVTSFFGG